MNALPPTLKYEQAPDVTIRDATREDAAQIAHVQHAAWVEAYPNEALGISIEAIEDRTSHHGSEEHLEGWRGIIAAGPTGHTWIAERNKMIVGFCDAKKEDGFNRLGSIYLLPSEYSKGTSNKLMSEALTWLGNSADIKLDVVSYNQRAISFYKKYGFDQTAQLEDYKGLPVIEMIRPAYARRPHDGSPSVRPD